MHVYGVFHNNGTGMKDKFISLKCSLKSFKENSHAALISADLYQRAHR